MHFLLYTQTHAQSQYVKRLCIGHRMPQMLTLLKEGQWIHLPHMLREGILSSIYFSPLGKMIDPASFPAPVTQRMTFQEPMSSSDLYPEAIGAISFQKTLFKYTLPIPDAKELWRERIHPSIFLFWAIFFCCNLKETFLRSKKRLTSLIWG